LKNVDLTLEHWDLTGLTQMYGGFNPQAWRVDEKMRKEDDFMMIYPMIYPMNS